MKFSIKLALALDLFFFCEVKRSTMTRGERDKSRTRALYTTRGNLIDEHQDKFSGQLEFTYTDILGRTQGSTMGVNKYSVGTTLLFPSLLRHCVYPFSDSTETRISVSGNVFLGKEP
jgi:hypothetical protein